MEGSTQQLQSNLACRLSSLYRALLVRLMAGGIDRAFLDHAGQQKQPEASQQLLWNGPLFLPLVSRIFPSIW